MPPGRRARWSRRSRSTGRSRRWPQRYRACSSGGGGPTDRRTLVEPKAPPSATCAHAGMTVRSPLGSAGGWSVGGTGPSAPSLGPARRQDRGHSITIPPCFPKLAIGRRKARGPDGRSDGLQGRVATAQGPSVEFLPRFARPFTQAIRSGPKHSCGLRAGSHAQARTSARGKHLSKLD